jgi:RNA polymerase sigma-70 factor (ECF subfamily)
MGYAHVNLSSDTASAWEPRPVQPLPTVTRREARDLTRTGSLRARTNDEWLKLLQDPIQQTALAELRQILLAGLRYALSVYGRASDDDLEDFVQEALLRVLVALDTFRGESRFTAWAQKIAVHVAFTELRRKRWSDVSLDELTAGDGAAVFIPSILADSAAGPERRAAQRAALEHLQRLITGELTARQRRALVAVAIHGMPLEEVARRMGTNRNALYKLLHDARQRLKNRMLLEGVSPLDVLDLF